MVVAVMYLKVKTKVNLRSTNLQKKQILIGPERPLVHSKRLIVPQKLSGSSSTLAQVGTSFSWKKNSITCIPVVRRAIPESWGTSNGTFQTKKVGDIKISFVDYSDSKRVHLKPDIVEYACNGAPPAYNLILGKQTLHNLEVVLDFKE